MKEFYVYMHVNKENGKKYIGITCQEPKKRWRNGKGYKNGSFANAINKYGWDNFEHKILYTKLNKENACKKEKELISKYHTMNSKYGYNLCEGGNVTTGYHHSKSSREKMSKLKKGMYDGKNNPMYGRKGNLSPVYGKHFTEEHKIKISEAKKGKYTNYIKSLRKKVNQYTLDGEFIKTWDSIADAERELKLKGTHISRVCRKKRKSTGGYIFTYCK